MLVQIRRQSAGKTPKVSSLRQKIELILQEAGAEGSEISILLTDDKSIHGLNREYRSMDKPTDVLSFPQLDDDFPGIGPRMLGDVVISMETASRQAAKAGHSTERELNILLVHGILHLLGYDHEKGAEDAREMKEMERDILNKLDLASKSV